MHSLDPSPASDIDHVNQQLQAWGKLNPFCLPQPLLEALTPRLRPLASQLPSRDALKLTTEDDVESPGFGCLVCEASFDEPNAQRAHFRSDWHRYNLKRGRRGGPLKEPEFFAIIDALEDSLSGSEDESDSSSDEDEHKKLEQEEEQENIVTSMQQRSPLVWFTAPAVLGEEVQFGIYRCILPRSFNSRHMVVEQDEDQERIGVLEELSGLQCAPASSSKAVVEDGRSMRTWTMLMVSGGHFAGMVVSTRPELRHVGKGKAPEQEMVILEHKTFHRYTTRRKQGGGQAAHDTGGKGMAKSAGANLRRYNEQALTEEIRALLASWSEALRSSELIFIRASKANSKIFFNYDQALLFRTDPRLRTLPFPTRRPTLNELKRSFQELTRVQITRLTKQELEAADELYLASLLPPKPAPPKPQPAKKVAPVKPQVDPAEQRLQDRWERVMDMVQKGRLGALQDFVAKHAEANNPDWTGLLPAFLAERMHVASVLHVAAMAEQADVVEWLLVERRCDPTSVLAQEVEGGPRTRTMTAYEVAGGRGTRNVFRRVMAGHPEWCDWVGAARVPSGLTEELEAQQSAKGKDRKQRLKEKLRERDKAREEAEAREKEQAELKEREEEQRKRTTETSAGKRGPQRLGGPAAVLSKPPEALGLTPEQRARLERERRARAAEARMKT
ncbi:hypothetical protein CROQUDRAFT_91383 [Cronartium quercuum f. sp. fusiforme G11]|uniref:VLRF1 domain-containing protein n=1 Tax=Cronartium quercuum f. sp. fusiforme G11 TaxID=708437 RepID=A0A9P6NIA5_9BASI|nr:hypothetical protein CROQUDRAFT_91383 [Cronartium quercuum f. sp. fusiforme G11]